jgi:hypothetical protein
MRDPSPEVSEEEHAAEERALSDRRSGDQRREAFRVAMPLAVFVDEPMELFCELVDISLLGLRVDREMPCTPGISVELRLEIPTYGGQPKPDELELSAEVVRVAGGFTGLCFQRLTRDQARAVRELVHGHQRRLLLADRPAALDRRERWLSR